MYNRLKYSRAAASPDATFRTPCPHAELYWILGILTVGSAANISVCAVWLFIGFYGRI